MASTSKQQRIEVPFVDLVTQYRAIEPEISGAIAEVLRHADFILGRAVGLFEEEFAAFCGVKHAVGVDSGMAALELSLRAYGIGAGDEVITAANSFIASALCISHTGATPVLIDVDPRTQTMDVQALQAAITPQTKAVIPVHLFGHPAHMDPINNLAQRHGLVVIEDACQAHGARYKGKRAGSLGHAAAFSFYPAKNLGGYGDGGMVVTDDDQVAERITKLRHYGQCAKYHHELRGFNHRLDTIQAAVLRVKLKYLDDWNAARRQHAQMYNRLLAGTEVNTPSEASYAESVWHLYVIRSRCRDELAAYLTARGISTGLHYPVPIHLQPAYRNLGYEQGAFPVTERCATQILSLPMYPELPPSSIAYVAEAIRAFQTQLPAGADRLAA